MVRIPFVETVPTTEPILELINEANDMALPRYLIKDRKDIFALMVIDDSMTGRVENGDLVLVQKGLMPENKDMAVLRLKDEYILREVEFIDEIVLLRSINEDTPTIHITEDKKDDFEIIGKVIVSITQNP